MQGDDDTNELLRRYEKGDASAATFLFDRHRARLRRMVVSRIDRRLAERVDPSDVVQDTLVEAFRRIDGYLEQRPIGFYPWLRQIAWNRMVDLFRQHRLAAKRSTDREFRPATMLSASALGDLSCTLISRERSPHDQVASEESVREVQRALQRLAAHDAEVLILRHIEQLSVAETAEVLSIAQGTVKSRQYRALVRLRELVTDPDTDLGSSEMP